MTTPKDAQTPPEEIFYGDCIADNGVTLHYASYFPKSYSKTKYFRADLVTVKLDAAEKMAGALDQALDDMGCFNEKDEIEVNSSSGTSVCEEVRQRMVNALALWQRFNSGGETNDK